MRNPRLLPPDRPGLPSSPSSPLFPSLLNAAILLLASAIGAVAFVAPFFSLETALPGDGGALSHAADAPFFLILLIVICLGAVLLNLSAGQMNTRTVAVLGILTAFNAVLRALPGPGGFNAIFFLPILAGHVYGATFGFLLGSLSLLVSALLGGGVGPWLPFQMFATGWVGMLGALAPSWPRHPRREVLLLAAWGLFLGLLFGAIMNLWFWPFVFRPDQAALYWQPGLGLAGILQRYLPFYLVTSLAWDLWRAGGNALLILFLGLPVLRLLRRFQLRFRFEITSEE
ncbi:MAG: ECF transporter S component [Anaerolineae bacterium]